MIGALKAAWDNFRGSGDAAVTVPPMDGALRPNRLIEESGLALAIEAPDDLAAGPRGVYVSAGDTISLMSDSGLCETVATFDSDVTALAISPQGRLAAALAEGGLMLADDGVWAAVDNPGGVAMRCITALAFASEDEILVAQGSASRTNAQWKRDLMERRADGSVWRASLATGTWTRLAVGLGWPYGVVATADGRVVVSESWRHRLVSVVEGRKPEPVLADLPGYPARLHRDSDGGYWLSVFAPRNQIIEFIQREPAFLARMVEEVDEAYWAAPSLKSSSTFLEPLQGGAQKHLGMLKPWAPTRSYGLVIRLDKAFRPVTSFHSRADGTRHGVTCCLPVGGRVLAASRGGNAVIEIASTERHGGDA